MRLIMMTKYPSHIPLLRIFPHALLFLLAVAIGGCALFPGGPTGTAVITPEKHATAPASVPAAPDAFVTSNNPIDIGNNQLVPGQAFTIGLSMINQGQQPIVLQKIVINQLPPHLTWMGTSIVRPEEHHQGGLGSAMGYPPSYQAQPHAPTTLYVTHPVQQALLQPQQEVDGAISFRPTQAGIFIARGFVVTLSIAGKSYQRAISTQIVLCVQAAQEACNTALQSVEAQAS
ncbi:hypothetical protein ccbrp13_21840 [Ktedonobacteria bacterium brp13]|nr:hypothetical protein ccbrp13_21840 [Ktedonobacteria bacterium brp13]